jgi:hypothetical protein
MYEVAIWACLVFLVASSLLPLLLVGKVRRKKPSAAKHQATETQILRDLATYVASFKAPPERVMALNLLRALDHARTQADRIEQIELTLHSLRDAFEVPLEAGHILPSDSSTPRRFASVSQVVTPMHFKRSGRAGHTRSNVDLKRSHGYVLQHVKRIPYSSATLLKQPIARSLEVEAAHSV